MIIVTKAETEKLQVKTDSIHIEYMRYKNGTDTVQTELAEIAAALLQISASEFISIMMRRKSTDERTPYDQKAYQTHNRGACDNRTCLVVSLGGLGDA